MKVLVIGGTRFIGRHLIPRLLEEGHEIHLFNRGQHPLPFSPGDVRVIHGDRKLPGQLATQLAGQTFDAVIDMVGYNAAEMKDAVAALAGKTGHYLLVSTRSVYQRPCRAPVRESDAVEQNPENAYGYHKAQAEKVLNLAHQEHGFPGTILRLPAVYGPYDYQAREWYFIRRLFDGRRQMLLPDGGLGVNHREYAGNIADQLAFLIGHRASIGETYNSGHRHYQTYRELVQMAAEIMGAELEPYSLPSQEMPWSIQLAEPGVNTHSTAKLESLGYRERFDVRAALAETIEYFRAHPLTEERPEHRNKALHFNYDLEDQLIKERAVRI